MKKTLSAAGLIPHFAGLLSILAAAMNANAQIVNIPDANFKAALVANTNINTNADTEIQTSEATAYTGAINVSNKSISDLTGIEAFTALTNLYCGSNQLTSLNVSANTALTDLSCSASQLTSLNVSANTALTDLICYSNQLTSLNVSANTALTELGCDNNQLTSLNVSANTALNYLHCHYNQLTSLNLSANTALIYLNCWSNQLTSLNLPANTALTNLGCHDNQLTSLDVSANTALTVLYCFNNQLTSLNVSANTALTQLSCRNNQLTSLNIKNGNNSNLITFSATTNPNLTCIQVDDAAYMNTNWASAKDTGASYSENCPVVVNELQAKEYQLQISPNPSDGKFTVIANREERSGKQSQTIIIYNVLGEVVYQKSLTPFPSPTGEGCPSGRGEGIDLSTQPAGIYFIQVQAEDKIYNSKLVVE